MDKENNRGSEASMDTKDIHNGIENEGGTAASVKPFQDDILQPSEISLASIDAKLEELPEIAFLTEELLTERRASAKAAGGTKKKRKKKKAAGTRNTQGVKNTSGTQKTKETQTHQADQANHADIDQSGEKAAFHTVETKAENASVTALSAAEGGDVPEVSTHHEEDVPTSKDNEAVTSKPESNTAVDRRKSRVIRTALIAAAVVVLGLIIFEGVRLAGIVNSVNFVKHGSLFGETETVVSESVLASYVSHSDDTKNVLLIGYDVDENGISRSDSMILLTLDHEHQKIKMTSLMRDMYVRIPGYGKRKLNAAFVYGGPELLLQTIYTNFGLQVDKYICVDYKAFVDVVNEIGGVQVDLEEMELEQFNKYVGKKESNKIYEAGSYVLNGKQTLTYCRIRKVGSDTARTARQREVLSKIMKKCGKMSLLELEHLLRITAPNVTTNLSLTEIFSLTSEGLSSMDYEMQGLRIPVDGAWYDLTIDGVSYVGVDLNANARYLFDFLYGDSETSSQLVERQAEVDAANDEWERSRYERKKARQNRG